MSIPKSAEDSRPFLKKSCERFMFIGFWSEKVNRLFDKIEKTGTNARVTHHDLFVSFINRECFGRLGKADRKKRVKGSKHDDLALPLKVIEFKLRSSALESLPGVLRNARDIFHRNDFLYFGYFRKRGKKDESKDIKVQGCIYYLLVVIFPKGTERLNLKDLLKEVKKEEMEFTKELAEKSGIEMDDEDLYAVGNMIKEIQLERKLEEKDKVIEEKDKTIEEKDKTIEEKDKIINELKEKLNNTKKTS